MIALIYKSIKSFFYQLKFKNKNVRFLSGNIITKDCVFEGYNSIGNNNYLARVDFGFGSYLSEDNKLVNVKIGKFCSLGSHIRNTRGRHPSEVFVSTHPAFFSPGKVAGFTFSDKQYFTEHIYNEDGFYATIGNDVWIGDNVTIQEGIVIGDGAIIGTNSLVTKNVEPYSINFGVPCRKIKYRFELNEIKLLIESRWWDRDLEWLMENQFSFTDINIFKELPKNKKQNHWE
ncbi:CatB-related O-acetyltransferase [Pedobacter sp. MC2016-05]|uniref:CatB-related O-acetyltransferase n=1 Tax=Pedobacter sp. MC2016-05 TaxID=2994474 RepID=UPI0022451BEA|nr:CatB-related O-acetyltransferase [Pedobacter sp. MC2016-05]MCX2473229.1 CatB-related O-acetyltransferase [Pedobacter sp. MC2016-05]